MRTIGNWLNLSTPLGLLVARLGGSRLEHHEDLWLASGYRLGFPVAGAFTVGSVVISRHDLPDLARRRPELLDHEAAHAWQWFALLGLPFLPAYLVAMAWSYARTGDRAAANVFEVRAGLESGGYRDPRAAQRPDRRRAERAR